MIDGRGASEFSTELGKIQNGVGLIDSGMMRRWLTKLLGRLFQKQEYDA
jgi:hypothetical protein